jgi:predicted Zn-dependent protease
MDPLSMLVQALPAWADVLEGEHERAIDRYRALLEQEPDNLLARLFVAWILTVNGRAKEVEQLATVFSDDESDSLPAQVTYGLAAAGRGQDPGLNLSAQDQQMASINDMYPRMLAQAYALAGNNEKALEWLSLAVSRGFINFPYLNEHDPLLTRLKGDQRYEDLLARVEQRWKDFAA